jgi:regulator of protease activity HflC (stomatin/prohibitin superfamily)
MIRERIHSTLSGWLMLTLLIAATGLLLFSLIALLASEAGESVAGVLSIIGCIVGLIVVAVLFVGFFIVNPNEAKVLTLFGKYSGSVKTDGFHWANPLLTKKRLSLRIRNFEGGQVKVNDRDGNPIEIAAVVVWRVVETAEASFEVDDYQHYVKVQSEAATRNLATQYPYDTHEDHEMSLRGNTQEIAAQLQVEIQERLEKAGVEVLEARLNHLAYAPEIASAMLQRQQAGAIIAARQRIVDGAVGMVEMALGHLARNKVVELDEERKAAMVSNLLVVLCSERSTQPVVNAGTLHH